MDGMINMELTKEEKKSTDIPQPVASSGGADYPWGLSVTLEDESLEKMGVDMAKHKICDEVMLHAKCKISRMSQSAQNGGDKNRTMELQITDMGLEGMAGDAGEEDGSDDLDWNEDKQSADKKLKAKGY